MRASSLEQGSLVGSIITTDIIVLVDMVVVV